MHYHDWRWDLKRYFFLNWVVLEEVGGGEGTPFQKFAEEEVYFFSNVCSLQSDYFASHICIQESLKWLVNFFPSLFGRYIKKEWQDDFEVDIKNILI